MNKRRSISREEFESLKRDFEELDEKAARTAHNIDATHEMARRREYADFDSPAGVERIRQFAKSEGIPFEEAAIRLAEREVPEMPPQLSTSPDLDDAELDRRIQKVARDHRVSYTEAAERVLEGERA